MDYLLGLYEKAMPDELSLEQKLVEAKRAGYDFVELSIDETDGRLARLDWSMAERAAMTATMYEHEIFFRSICLSGHRKYPLGSSDAGIRERSLDIMEKAIKLAYDLGIRIIQIAGYDVYYEDSTEETVGWFEENLQKSVSMAARYGVILAFETMETEFLNTVEKCMYYVNKINSPYLQVYPDIGNITNAAVKYQTSAVADLETGRGHIVAAHLKETKPDIFREVPYGDGHVDFTAMVAKTRELGINYFVTEFWDVGLDSWREDLVSNRLFISEFLQK